MMYAVCRRVLRTCPARAGAGPLVLLAAALAAAPARAQSADNVLVLVNAASDVSWPVADYYARKRGIPREHLLPLRAPVGETISRAEYLDAIERPVSNWLAAEGLQDHILYIVLTKGMPLRVSGTEGRNGTAASVDSELTLLYRKLVGLPVVTPGFVDNPYFLGDRPVREARPFSHRDHDIYLVTRLDGYTLEDVFGLIERGLAPSRDGAVALDMRGALVDRGGDRWLRQAADTLAQSGFGDRVVLEQTPAPIRDLPDVLGYYSWGSNDPAITFREPGLRFVPGALAASYVSTDGRTLVEPPASWQIGNWVDRRSWFGGSPQSLAGDTVRAGVTGVAAHVFEPFLDATIRPQILFPAYLQGMNLAEAFYLAMPFVSWQTVILGDPLCAPFRAQPLTETAIGVGTDPASGLPAAFADRRAATLSRPGIDPAAVRLLLKAEGRLAAGDRPGARDALEQATGLASRLTIAQVLLASLYEGSREYDKAVARYRQLADDDPNNVFALNNLAYGLAERKGMPSEALPYAERAYRLSPADPGVLDTLGWIHHLLGDSRQGLPLLAESVRLAPTNAEIHLHAAVVAAAAGRQDDARGYLRRAIELAPALADSDQVATLRLRLRQ